MPAKNLTRQPADHRGEHGQCRGTCFGDGPLGSFLPFWDCCEIEGLLAQEAPEAICACVRGHHMQSDARHDKVGAASTTSARLEDGLRIFGCYRLVRERERGGASKAHVQ